ncbi:MAG: hypothetical protein GX963_15750 [Bacteroidales bacterium]|nr:hypothetical protein [Bacteroidales bacterium]
MNGNQTADMSKELLQFCDNLKHDGKQNMLNHNLYEITSVDINGNVVDRKFGVNLVTNRGMLFHYKDTANYSRYHLSIGIGTGTPSVTDTTLFNKLDWSNTRSDTYWYFTTLKYDSLSGIISNTQRVLEVYYDYNITGVDSPTNITEFGLTDSSGNLMTHSLIYDVNGNVTSIIKNINERLYFKVYRTVSFKEDLINDAWDNGCYIILSGYDTEMTSGSGYRYRCWIDYSRNNNNSTSYGNPYNYIRASNVTSTPSSNGVVINEPVTISNVLQEYDESIVSVTLGNNPKGYQNGQFRVMKRLRLQTPEEVTLPYLQTQYYASKSFEQMFGHINKGGTGTGYYPITDYNMETLTTYNVDTHEWDIPVPFSSPSNCDYCNYFDSPTRIYINFNGVKYLSVYFNINLDLPILALSGGGTDPIYATDKYWDTSTYEIIPDVTNIPVGLRNKKYYITEANNVALTPTTTRHEVIPHKEAYVIDGFTDNYDFERYGMGFSSEQYNWVIRGNSLLFITDSSAVRCALPWGRSSSVPLFYTTGDIFIYWYNSKFNIVDATIPSTTLQTIDLVLNFDGVAVGTPMFTFTDYGPGYVVCQHLTTNKTVIIDLHGDTENNRPTQYLLENTKHCNAILCTKYCVYQRSDITDVHTFEIYDMETQTVVSTFNIPSIDGDITTVVLGVRAWSKFIYVRLSVGTNYVTYLHRMDDNTTSSLTWDAGTNMNTSYFDRPVTHAVDECMVFQSTSHNTSGNGYGTVSHNDPTKLLVLVPKYSSGTDAYDAYTDDILELKKIDFNGGTKILMSIKYSRRSSTGNRSIFDMGYFIDNPNDIINQYNPTGYYPAPMVYYKNGYIDLYNKNILRWYPIEQLLMYRATGTTRSIQCMNNPKRISQSFNMKTTNDSSIWSIE